MSTRDKPWAPGTPNWVDLMAKDRQAAWDFYGRLFGWEFIDSGPDMGNYGIATLNGHTAAGVGETPPGQDAPQVWTTYLATDDLDATTEAVTANGGQLIMPAMDIPGQGRMAVAVDPTGATFGIWQSAGMIGASIVNEPGAFVWNECQSRDPEAARAFYAAVFGYTYTPMPDADYSTINGEGPGDTIGGIGGLDASAPADTPSNWLTYFAVADAKATADLTTALGGTVDTAPFDTEYGRMAELRDPAGARFSIMENTSGQ